ncbi:hypothetical protein G6F61_000481 [Rhizopus arrhizus]|nr:hypothetical protein G6F61_000481 [Rhizopus arrhizus]
MTQVPEFSFSLQEITSEQDPQNADWNFTVDRNQNSTKQSNQWNQWPQQQYDQNASSQQSKWHSQANNQSQPTQSQWGQQVKNVPQTNQSQWGQQSNIQQQASQSQYAQGYDQPQTSQSQWGQQANRQPQTSQTQYNQGYSQPQANQNQWGQQTNNQAQANQTQWGQSAYNEQQISQSHWNQPSSEQQNWNQAPQNDILNNPQGTQVSKYAQSNEQPVVPTVELNLSQLTSSLASETSSDPNIITGLFGNPNDVRVKTIDTQMDPNSSLYSVKSFEDLGLREDLLKGLYAMGFSKPSKVQEKALPLIISDPPTNMIAQSQSGTGKTAAFVLCMLSRVDSSLDKPQAICLVPSRELARQIRDVTASMAKFTSIKAVSLIKEAKRRVFNEHIIVGTPGTVHDCIRRRYIDITNIRVFVLDEADNMLDQDGLGDQSIRIKNMITNNPQLLLFSATFPDHVHKFAFKFAPNANEISLATHELSVDAIKQFYMDCADEKQKYDVLCNLYDLLTVSQSIIFCRRRETAFEIGDKMRKQGHATCCLHGGMLPDERDRIMDEFRRGEFKVLITTNVISRGIDILQVSLVVNYDMPIDARGHPDSEAYLHRIGRTGRFGRTGVSIIFVYNNESWKQMKFLEQHFQKPIERVPTEDWEEVERILKPVL